MVIGVKGGASSRGLILQRGCKGEAMRTLQDWLDRFSVQHTYLLVTAMGTLLAAICAVLVWGRGWTVARRFWHGLQRPRLRLPRKTLSIFPLRRYPLLSDQRWHMVSVGEQPAMQIVGAWHVTNMAKEPIHMHSAHIVRPRKARTSGEVFVIDPQTNCAGDWFLAPRSTAQALTQFVIHSPYL